MVELCMCFLKVPSTWPYKNFAPFFSNPLLLLGKDRLWIIEVRENDKLET